MSLAQRTKQSSYFAKLPLLKKLFWLYFLLLIFEGALRKWALPQLSAPLLLVRDPVGLYIIWEAYRTFKWPRRWSTLVLILMMAFLGLCVLQIVVGDNPWFVGIYGLRSYLLPFPVAFVMGDNLDEDDLRRFGGCTLWILVPMVGLEVAQYVAPSDSILNRGAYEGGSQLSYTGAHVRASGTFSFVTGSADYSPLAAAFIFYGMAKEKFVARWLLWASSFALILSLPVVGSRFMIFEVAGVLICVGIGAMLGISNFAKTLRIIAPLLIISLLVSYLPIFSDATNSLTTRFTEATNQEGGSVEQTLLHRAVDPVERAMENADFAGSWMGVGMGRGAAAMATLLTGTQVFLTGEDELSREIIELGPLPGMGFGLFRFLLAIYLFGQALARARDHDPLALLLAPLTLTSLIMGVMEQPTGQGFDVMCIAFTIAAIKTSQERHSIVPVGDWTAIRKPSNRMIAR